MLRTFAIFVFIFPSITFAIEDIFNQNNASFYRDKPIVSNDSNQNAYNNGMKTADSLPNIWVADMFYRALSNFTIQKNVGSTACQKQTEMYIWNLRNNTYWAVKSKY